MTTFLLLARYSLAGVVNGIVSYSVIFACMALGLTPGISNALGYGAGLVTSFLQSKHWVFRSHGRMLDEWLRFVVVFLISYAANFATLKACISAGVNVYLAQLIACAAYVAVSFVLNSKFVFRKRRA
ncbi:MAG TPA: GtrA family protein [Rudaea sp.]|jgi:putative flippase GtrA|nr:GtrA family protein [Rudaea sp.]